MFSCKPDNNCCSSFQTKNKTDSFVSMINCCCRSPGLDSTTVFVYLFCCNCWAASLEKVFDFMSWGNWMPASYSCWKSRTSGGCSACLVNQCLDVCLKLTESHVLEQMTFVWRWKHHNIMWGQRTGFFVSLKIKTRQVVIIIIIIFSTTTCNLMIILLNPRNNKARLKSIHTSLRRFLMQRNRFCWWTLFLHLFLKPT